MYFFTIDNIEDNELGAAQRSFSTLFLLQGHRPCGPETLQKRAQAIRAPARIPWGKQVNPARKAAVSTGLADPIGKKYTEAKGRGTFSHGVIAADCSPLARGLNRPGIAGGWFDQIYAATGMSSM